MTIKLDDSELYEIVYSPVCALCKHLDVKEAINKKRKCNAFAHIPDEIWNGKNDHTEPYPGDNGIMFEPAKRNKK